MRAASLLSEEKLMKLTELNRAERIQPVVGLPFNPATEPHTRVLQTLSFTLKFRSFTPSGTPNKPNDTCFR